MPAEHPIVAARTRGKLWRIVEAQHVVTTRPLVDSLAEQALLEDVLEQTKPPVPAQATGLHWLLFTPFRYPPRPVGTRFRGRADPGVWYGAERIETACAELGYWRWRFLRASPALAALAARSQTAFRVEIDAPGVDLRRPPFDADARAWTHPTDYTPCQALARRARAVGVQAIRYASVRDPAHRGCAALLHWRAFSNPKPIVTEGWWLEVTRERVFWRAADPLGERTLEFETRAWA